MENEDDDILHEYLLGSPKAIEMLFERHKTPVFNFCLRILGSRADAEDITGDVFLAMLSNKYTPTPGAKFSTWLFTVARNYCLTRLRRRKKWVSVWFASSEAEDREWEIPDKNQDLPREELAKKESAVRVRKAIHQLPEEQREAIILREYHQMPYDEIAKILGCSLEKVKILIYRARERLLTDLSSFITEGSHD